MSIEKKSLISTLKTTKKANVAKEDLGNTGTIAASVKSPATKVFSAKAKAFSAKGKAFSAKGKAFSAKGKAFSAKVKM
jgi:hypothetical protein